MEIQPKTDYKVLVKCFTYNQRAYIEGVMSGFVMQRTEFPYICVVVDDASTDGEQDVINDFLHRECKMDEAEVTETDYGFITYVSHKLNTNCHFLVFLLKQNHHQARKGKYRYFSAWREKCQYEALCEGDDYWIDPMKLQKQVDFMDSHPDHFMCGSNGLILTEGGLRPPKYFNSVFESRDLTPGEIIGKWPLPTASLLYKTCIFDEYLHYGGKIYSGDQTLILLSLNNGPVYCFDDLMVVYRVNDKSNSLSAQNRKIPGKFNREHLRLYTYYSEYTKGKFKAEIDRTIKLHKNIVDYIELKNRNILLPLIKMPVFTLKDYLRSLKRAVRGVIVSLLNFIDGISA